MDGSTSFDDSVVRRSERGSEVDPVLIKAGTCFVINARRYLRAAVTTGIDQLSPVSESLFVRRTRICARPRKRINFVRRLRREAIRTGIRSRCRLSSFSTCSRTCESLQLLVYRWDMWRATLESTKAGTCSPRNCLGVRRTSLRHRVSNRGSPPSRKMESKKNAPPVDEAAYLRSLKHAVYGQDDGRQWREVQGVVGRSRLCDL
ncbi:unnamed protein product [Haemonchus placei]|uniref:Uncharacterized protein n=1 Tax=Haemonchus placei TaxID=6290 RepID=A0A0N4WLM4_HAEPC|nr:unnamed protein product [Haemonchus placei]